MPSNSRKYSPEFREAAVREVTDKSRPIADVARENNLVAQTLGNWVAVCYPGARGRAGSGPRPRLAETPPGLALRNPGGGYSGGEGRGAGKAIT